MPTTPRNGFRYPAATDAPDGPGGFLNLAIDIDNTLASGTWIPTLGGTGATLGSNSVVNGSWSQVGKHISAKGRIVFGSSGSFGTGTPVIGGLPATISTSLSTGYGVYIPTGGGAVTPVFFQPFDGATMTIKPVISQAAGSLATLGNGYALGTPAQSTILLFAFDLTTP